MKYSYEGDRIRATKDDRTMGFIHEHDEDREYWMSKLTIADMVEPVMDFVIDRKFFDEV